MFHIILFEPEIPPNTGNIIRLAANCGAQLHLIQPMSFDLSEKQVRRAGLDYHDMANLKIHDNFQSCVDTAGIGRIFACTTKGQRNYSEIVFKAGDGLLFGPESRGLPMPLMHSLGEEQMIRIPMKPQCRSLNLSNAVAIISYEVWRQMGFNGNGV